MTCASVGPSKETNEPAPPDDPRHPLAGAGEPVSEEAAKNNRDREPPA